MAMKEVTWNLLIEDYDRKVQEGEAYLRQAGYTDLLSALNVQTPLQDRA